MNMVLQSAVMNVLYFIEINLPPLEELVATIVRKHLKKTSHTPHTLTTMYLNSFPQAGADQCAAKPPGADFIAFHFFPQAV